MGVLMIVLIILLALVAALYVWSTRMAADAEAAVPQAGEVLPVRGGATHYVESGPRDAPTIVLIHGISAQLQHWTYAVADKLADDFHVIALDRPGCGYSTRDRDELAALPEQARMIWEFLDAKGIERPVIAGHSLGGALTLAMALQRPEGMAAMALVSPLTRFQSEVVPIFKGLEVRSHAMRRLLAHTIAGPMARMTAAKVIDFAFDPEPPIEDFMIGAAAVLGLRPKAYITASCDLVMLEHVMQVQQSRYGEIKVPGGVLYGDGDTLLAAAVHGRPMAEYGLDYEELPGRGHMLPMTEPDVTEDFIRRMAAKARP